MSQDLFAETAQQEKTETPVQEKALAPQNVSPAPVVTKKEVEGPDGDLLAIVVTGNAELDVKQFHIKDSEIQRMKLQFGELKINSLDDREIYKQVYEARQYVRKNRLSVDKTGAVLLEGAKSYVKDVTAEQKRLIAELKEIEQMLQIEEDKYEQLKADAALELEREAEKVATNRASQLIDMGLAFTGKYYQIEIDGNTQSIEHNKLSAYTEPQWLNLIAELKPACDAIKKEREEAAERAAEAERENARLREEIERKDKRTNQLLKLGLNFTGDTFRLEEIVIESSELTALDNEQWDVLIERVGPIVTERIAEIKHRQEARDNEEKARKEAAEKLNIERQRVLQSYGIDTSYTDLSTLTDEEFTARLEKATTEANERKEKAAKDELRAERTRATNSFLPYLKIDEIFDGDFAEMTESAYAQYLELCKEAKVRYETEQAELRERAEKQKQQEEAAAKEAKEREEKELAAALAPDIEKLAELAARIRALQVPTLNVNNDAIVSRFNDQREKFAAWVEGLSKS